MQQSDINQAVKASDNFMSKSCIYIGGANLVSFDVSHLIYLKNMFIANALQPSEELHSPLETDRRVPEYF